MAQFHFVKIMEREGYIMLKGRFTSTITGGAPFPIYMFWFAWKSWA
jgi:hypothetical protein